MVAEKNRDVLFIRHAQSEVAPDSTPQPSKYRKNCKNGGQIFPQVFTKAAIAAKSGNKGPKKAPRCLPQHLCVTPPAHKAFNRLVLGQAQLIVELRRVAIAVLGPLPKLPHIGAGK